MHVDWWTLGLQAINVLILIWLLGHFFWNPVARIIAQRQQVQQDMLAQAQAARDAAVAERSALARSDQERAQLRDEALAKATAEAAQLRAQWIDQAQHDVQEMLNAARAEAAKLHDVTQRQLAREGADLGLRIARRLLGRIPSSIAQQAFCAALERSVGEIPQGLLAGARTAGSVEVVSSAALDETQRDQCMKYIAALLGSSPTVRWRVDASLLAGVELHAGDLVVRNSWHADLQQIAQELGHE